MGFLHEKKALIVGLASNRSIAWGIAQAMRREGAELAFTCQSEKLQTHIEKMAAELDSEIVIPCDVASDNDINNVFNHLDDYWDHLDIIVHSVAYAPRDALDGDYLDTLTRASFNAAHEISSYSFAALAKAGRNMMEGRNSALITISHIGAERTIPNYNVMGPAKASLEANVRYMAASLGPDGIRVNSISAGPIRTAAATDTSSFRNILSHVEKTAPLRRNITIEELGNTAAFLCSDLASGITGENIYVDCGYNTASMIPDESPLHPTKEKGQP